MDRRQEILPSDISGLEQQKTGLSEAGEALLPLRKAQFQGIPGSNERAFHPPLGRKLRSAVVRELPKTESMQCGYRTCGMMSPMCLE